MVFPRINHLTLRKQAETCWNMMKRDGTIAKNDIKAWWTWIIMSTMTHVLIMGQDVFIISPSLHCIVFFFMPHNQKKCHRAHYDSCLDSRPSRKHQLLWVPGEELEYGNHSPLDSPSKLRTKECSLPIWWPFFGRDLAEWLDGLDGHFESQE